MATLRKRRRSGRERLRRLQLEMLEDRRVLNGDWQNPLQPRDVTADGLVSPLDALLILNDINSNGTRALSFRPVDTTIGYLDVSGDDFVSAVDVLLVINELNGNPTQSISAQLANDTGTTASQQNDRRTSDPTITGQIPSFQAGMTLKFGSGFSPAETFDITNQLSGQTFTLNPATMETTLGIEFEDGPYQFTFQVYDAGSLSATSRFSFVMDTMVSPLQWNLNDTSDTGLKGDFETSRSMVALSGVTEAGATVEIIEFAVSTRAGDDGSFSFDNLPLVDGDNSFTLNVVDFAGNMRSLSRSITRVAVEEDLDPPLISMELLEDTGVIGNDRITNTLGIRGRINDESTLASVRIGVDNQPSQQFTDITANVAPDGTFELEAATVLQLFGGAVDDGLHQIHLQAEDQHGNASPMTSLGFELDRIAPILTGVDLALASDTGTRGDLTTDATRVTIVGMTERNAIATLTETAQDSMASATGRISFPNVELAIGDTTFHFEIVDVAGNVGSSVQASFTRSSAAVEPDLVLQWHDLALEAIRRDATTPPEASRALAMMSISVLDVVSAFEGTPAFLVGKDAPHDASLDAAITAAAYEVLLYEFPAQKELLDDALSGLMPPVSSSQAEGVALGESIAHDVIAIRSLDGWDHYEVYSTQGAVGDWQATGPMFDLPLLPQWASLTPFLLESNSQFQPPAPPALDSAQYAIDFKDVQAVGRLDSSVRTADQTEIARFWGDGGGTYTPPGHWNQIATDVALQAGNSISSNARLMAQLNVALADAAIVAWDAKYAFGLWRPVTAIQNASQDGNNSTNYEANWDSLLINPPFPEYVSGHSTFSGAAAQVLTELLGDNVAFDATSLSLPGVQRSYSSFQEAAEEAGRSRVYGGVHYEFSNQSGLQSGRELGQFTLDAFGVDGDRRGPSIILDPGSASFAANNNRTISGHVIDNLSGVKELTVRIDDGASQTVTLDATGAFAFATTFATDGSEDGIYELTFEATDRALNHSRPSVVSFNLDTLAPVIDVTTITEGAALTSGPPLQGTVDSTGSPLVRFDYAFDDGITYSTAFSATDGSFSQPLDLSRLEIGPHQLQVTAVDAAGNQAEVTFGVNLNTPMPLKIARVTPTPGSGDIGRTFRPQVYFSRPIDTTTLTRANFYATDPSGNVIPSRVVPAADGSFAWLFFEQPLPGASTITVHLDGTTIRSAGDRMRLDADGDGTAGGTYHYRFSTVGSFPLAGTSLSGIVLDPGPDLHPMTIDDVLSGPDGAPHTADDEFLLPIAGAKVFILGLENQVAITDSQGRFHFASVPAGTIKLAVDGQTATNAPAGVYFPEMVMDLQIIPGQANTVMGSMGTRQEREANFDREELYLPRVERSILTTISDSQTTVVGVEAKSAPDLTDAQREFLKLEVEPGSLLGPDGSPLTGASAEVGLSAVPPELVRDMLPPGLLQHTFDITIQAPGTAQFATPLRLTFPNTFGAAPGTKINYLSFDHTTGRLVIEGTATVSADGKSIATDAGSGITKPGWHGAMPPGSNMGGRGKRFPDDRCGGKAAAAEAIGAAEQGVKAAGNLLGVAAAGADTLTKLGTQANALSGLSLAADAIDFVNDPSLASFGKIALSGLSIFSPPPIALAARLTRGVWAVAEAKIQLDLTQESIDRAREACGQSAGSGSGEGSLIQDLISDIYEQRDSYQVIENVGPRVLRTIQNLDFEAIDLGQSSAEKALFLQRLTQLKEAWEDLSQRESIEVLAQKLYDAVIARYLAAVTAFNGGVGVSYVAVNINGVTNHTTTDQNGNWSFFAPPDSFYKVSIVDPHTGWSGEVSGFTAASGQDTELPDVHVVPSLVRADTDGDRLSDDAERTIGTSITLPDTDADQLTDYAELIQGLDPLSGLPVATGVIATNTSIGSSTDVVVVESTSDVDSRLALVTTVSKQLAILDVTSPFQSKLLGSLPLTHRPNSLAYAAENQAAVVATNNGLIFVDISDPEAPQEIGKVQGAYTRVAVHDGLAYTIAGRDLKVIDTLTYEVIASTKVSDAAVLQMEISGNALFLLNAFGECKSFSLFPQLQELDSLQADATQGLFVGDTIAYAGGAGGYQTIDIQDPSSLQLIGDRSSNNLATSQVADSGSGQLIGTGFLFFAGNVLHVLDARDPQTTNAFITETQLSGTPTSLELAGGLAYVATSTGLQTVNYLGVDTQGQPPTVSVSIASADADANTAGIQLVEGTSLELALSIEDDVQIRNMELLLDDIVVASGISYPFDLTTSVPALLEGETLVSHSLLIRATDTGGNVGMSDVLLFEVIPDTVGPTMTVTIPANGELVYSVPSIDILFDEALDPASLSGISLTYLGADGVVGGGDDIAWPLDDFVLRRRDSQLKILPSQSLTTGTYRVVTPPETLTDTVGNVLADPIVFEFTVRPASSIVAISGTPAIPRAPSANAGQLIAVSVENISKISEIDFPVSDSSGQLSSVAIRPEIVDALSGIAYFRVPDTAVTGDIQIPGDPSGPSLLQIVPVIDSVDVRTLTETAGDWSARVELRGTGFSEGDGLYRLGNTEILDPDTGSAIVNVDRSNYVGVDIPLSTEAFGAVIVNTTGGTSEPWSLGYTNLNSQAITGTPADASLASANPLQTVELLGDGLTTSSDIVAQYTDALGDQRWRILNPMVVSPDGSRAELQIPDDFNGVHPLLVFGSDFQPSLQVLPQVDAARLDLVRRVRLDGRGFEERTGNTYSFAGKEIVSTQLSQPPVDVGNGPFSNGILFLWPEAHGFGPLTITNLAGSTSYDINWMMPDTTLDLRSVSRDGTSIWALTNLTLNQFSLLDGSQLKEFSNPTPAKAALQVLTEDTEFEGVIVPAGSLLLAAQNGDLYAVDSTSGDVIASRTDWTDYTFDYGTRAMLYDADAGRLYLIDDHFSNTDFVAVIDLENGETLTRWPTPGLAMAADPSGSSLWIEAGSEVVQFDLAGNELRRVDIVAQNVGTAVTGMAFSERGSLLVYSKRGGLFEIDIDPPESAPPELLGISATSLAGSPADPNLPSANIDQTIRITGKNLRRGTAIRFETVDQYGAHSTVNVPLEIVNQEGTQGWLQVPGWATTGNVMIPGDPAATELSLQIVPVVQQMTGTLGIDANAQLYGSGFVEGGTTLTVGGIVHQDIHVDDHLKYFDGNVYGASNDTYLVRLYRAIEGPITITTEGGSFTYTPAAPELPLSPIAFEGIESVASYGAAENPDLPSAHPGQPIRLVGHAFDASTLVQFPAVDDHGGFGYLTRVGTPADDGRSLDVDVPARAVSGLVRVVGSDTALPLQIVPRVDSIGGQLSSGNTIVLTGVGFSSKIADPIDVRVDGVRATDASMQTVYEYAKFVLYFNGAPQQAIQFTVPDGITDGSVVTVSTPDGGTGSLRLQLSNQDDIVISQDVGDTAATVETIDLQADSMVLLPGLSIGDGAFASQDVDLFSVDLNAGDQLVINAQAAGTLAGTELNPLIRIFDDSLVQLAFDDDSGAPPDALLRFEAPASGNYILGISNANNPAYDPTEAGSGPSSGDPSAVGAYQLYLERVVSGQLAISEIDSIASSGTPTVASIASAIQGQTIELRVPEGGLDTSSRVVFDTVDDAGRTSQTSVVPASVASDGKSLEVIVPPRSISGRIRLSNERQGRFLQIVPTVTDVDQGLGDQFHKGVLVLSGTSLIEGASQVWFGSTALQDVSYFGPPISGFGHSMHVNVPSGLSSGPLTVRTLGGTSEPFNLQLISLQATADSGIPADPNLPSANPGQTIRLVGEKFDNTTDVVFQLRDAFGTLSERVVRPTFVSDDGTQADVIVPLEATTGVVLVVGDLLGSALPLQIVPTVDSADVTLVLETAGEWFGRVILHGSGFSEGDGLYRFGTTEVVDPNISNTTVAVLSHSNDRVQVDFPLSPDAFGAVTVTTAGGTSAPWSVDYTALNSLAPTGTPADPNQPSANPGQTLELIGSNLSTDRDILAQKTDTGGKLIWQLLNPNAVSGDGSVAEVDLPGEFNGSHPFPVFGSDFLPTLQVLPRIDTVFVDATRRVRLDGGGFEERLGNTYSFAGQDVVSTQLNREPVNVAHFSQFESSGVHVWPTHHGFGDLSITNPAGTSTIGINWMMPETVQEMTDIDRDATSIWARTNNNRIQRYSLDDGSLLADLPDVSSANGGLHVLTSDIELGGVNVPAGNLLLVSRTADIYAIDANTGNVLTSRTDWNNYSSFTLGATFDFDAGRLYLLDDGQNDVVALDLTDGSEVARWDSPIPVNVGRGGLRVSPSGSTLWMAISSTAIQFDGAGNELKRVDLAAQNFNGLVDGFSFDDQGHLLAVSSFGVIHDIDPSISPLRAASVGQFCSAAVGTHQQLDLETIEAARALAIEFWAMAGLPIGLQERLWATEVEIASLPNGYLGLGSHDVVLIDDDGAGLGWRGESDAATTGFDLATVLAHEFGHVLGLEDTRDDDSELMYESLLPGDARSPAPDLVDSILEAWYGNSEIV